MDLRSTLLVIGGSACSFKLLNTIFRCLPAPETARKKAWRWRNICTSLAHSSLTGTWAVLCLYREPQMAKDLISSHSLSSHSLVAVSTGYFINDFLDGALNQPFKQSWEVLLHHSVVISCFILAATSRLYVGFSVVSLLIEINSVFLHVRQLLLLSGRRNRPGTEISAPRPSVTYSVTSWLTLGTWSKHVIPVSQVISCFILAATSRLYVGFSVVSLLIEINSVFLHVRQLLLLSGRRNRPGTEISAPRPSVTYSVTSWLTLGTLLVFRVCTAAWMTRWLAANGKHMPRYVLTMGTVGLSLVSSMNVVLFYRLLRADVLNNTHSTSRKH